MVAIIVIILSAFMTVGGIIPNVANGILYQEAQKALNNPKELRVKIHSDSPSYLMLGKQLPYLEIEAKDFTMMDLNIAHLQIQFDRLEFKDEANLSKPSQAVVQVKVTESALNNFFKTERSQLMMQELTQFFPMDVTFSNINVDLQPETVLLNGQANALGGFFTIPFQLNGQLSLLTETNLKISNVGAKINRKPLPVPQVEKILNIINSKLSLSLFNSEDFKMFFRHLTIDNDSIRLTGELKVK